MLHTFSPTTKGIYFILSITASLIFNQYPFSLISFIFSFIYLYIYKNISTAIKVALILIIASAMSSVLSSINILANTKELAGDLIWSETFNQIFPSFNYSISISSTVMLCMSFGGDSEFIFSFLSGKFPKTTLFIYITLGNIPLIMHKIQSIYHSMACLGYRNDKNDIISKIKFRVYPIYIALSDSAAGCDKTASFLESKGYIGYNTNSPLYNHYGHLTSSDLFVIALMSSELIILLIISYINYLGIIAYTILALFFSLPIILRILEEIKWTYL